MARKHDKHNDHPHEPHQDQQADPASVTPEDAPEDAPARRDDPHPQVHAPENAADKMRDLVPPDQGTLKPSEDAPAEEQPQEKPAPEEPASPAEPTQSAAVSIPFGESRVLRIQADGEIRSLIEYTIDDASIIGANLAGTDFPALRVRGKKPGTTTLRVAADNDEGVILKAVVEVTVAEPRGSATSIDIVEQDLP